MFPLIGGLISGGASLLSSFFGSETSAKNTQANIAAQQAAQRESEEFNAGQADLNRMFAADQAQENRSFQSDQAGVQRGFEEQMSNTAYQRASQDMQKAGLNPMMMFGSGGAASTPSVSAPSGSVGSASGASIGTPNMAFHNAPSALAGLGDAVSKAFSSAMQIKTYDKMTDEIANLQTERAKLEAQTALTSQETSTEKERTLQGANTNSLLALRMPGARFSAKSAEDLESMPEWLRRTLVIGGFGGDKLGDTLRPVSDLLSSAQKVRSLMPSRSTSERTYSGGGSDFTDRWSGLYN